jgi:DNA-binding beta-propeller fold protein YncE
MSCGTPGSVIRYTTDGTNPATNGVTYTGPIDVPAGTTTVKAYAFASGWIDSGQAAGDFEMCNEVMYSATYATPGFITAYYLDGASGSLEKIPGPPVLSGDYPNQIRIHPSGRFLYADNYSSNSISAYSIDQATGTLSPISGSPFPTGGAPYGFDIDPLGRFIYAASNSTTTVSAFMVNQLSGALSPITTGTPYPTGTGPIAIGIDPSSKFAYVVNFSSNNITGFSI